MNARLALLLALAACKPTVEIGSHGSESTATMSGATTEDGESTTTAAAETMDASTGPLACDEVDGPNACFTCSVAACCDLYLDCAATESCLCLATCISAPAHMVATCVAGCGTAIIPQAATDLSTCGLLACPPPICPDAG